MAASGRVVAIVAAAGSGKRLGLRTKKPFVRLDGKPLIVHTLKALDGVRAIDAIIVAAEPALTGRFENIVRRYGIRKVVAVVAGGATRTESVRNCLNRVGDEFGVILIHDGGRPFIDAGTIRRSVAAARKFGGAVVAVPENDTVKSVGRDLFITGTLDRSRVYRAQTPQAFRRDVIMKAYAKKTVRAATDDAGLVERAGGKVKIVVGSYRNIKITTKEDLKLAEVFL